MSHNQLHIYQRLWLQRAKRFTTPSQQSNDYLQSREDSLQAFSTSGQRRAVVTSETAASGSPKPACMPAHVSATCARG